MTAAQLRQVVERLVAAGQWKDGDADIMVVMDAGYDPMRLAHVLADLPVEVVGRLRSDRVLRGPAPTWAQYAAAYPAGGRPPKHGARFKLADPDTWPEPALTTSNDTARYGKAEARAWDRIHPFLTHRSAWIGDDGELPLIEGTLIRLKVDHLPGDRQAPPVWLWSSQTGATAEDVDFAWSSYLRRFDLEHTFRFLKQTLGWGRPRLRSPETADRWTWLVVAAHTQLRLRRPAHHRPAPPMGEDQPPRPAPGPGPGPPRVSEHPTPLGKFGPCTQTLQARTGTAARHPEPNEGHPLRRGQNCQTTSHPDRTRPNRTGVITPTPPARPGRRFSNKLSLFFFFRPRTVSRTESLTWGFAGRGGGLRLIMCSDQGALTKTKAVRVSLLPDAVRREAFAEASRFRGELNRFPSPLLHRSVDLLLASMG